MGLFHRERIARAVVLFFLALHPVLARAQVAWVKHMSAALKQAAKEKKFVVLDISASW
jgi:hypothetical protein